MIDISNLQFSYGMSGRRVFDNFSLRLEENHIYGLLGKNGTGKSTLLYLVSGLLRARHGSVIIDGRESSERSAATLGDIFMVSEVFTFPPERISRYAGVNKVFYPRFSDDIFRRCLDGFQIGGDPRLDQLSMGQQKKVLMSFALAARTKYLFMDEPTNGLDIPSKAQFRQTVAENMTDDRTVVISTHQVHDIEQLLDHILIIDETGIRMNQSVADICDKYVFEYRTPGETEGVIYAEPALQGNAVIAERNGREETSINLELLFNAAVNNKL